MSVSQQYDIQQEYRRDQMRRADHHRLVQSIASPSRKRGMSLARIYKPTLYRLGLQLESLGYSLKVRYGDLKPHPTD